MKLGAAPATYPGWKLNTASNAVGEQENRQHPGPRGVFTHPRSADQLWNATCLNDQPDPAAISRLRQCNYAVFVVGHHEYSLRVTRSRSCVLRPVVMASPSGPGGDVHVDGTRNLSLYEIIGLPILYSSSYFIPMVSPGGAYLLQSRDLFRLIVVPSMIAVVFGSLTVYAAWTAARRWRNSRFLMVVVAVALSFMTMIAMKVILFSAGYDLENFVYRGGSLKTSEQIFKLILWLVLIASIWLTRRWIPKWSRVLSSLGFAFGALGIVRLVTLALTSNVVPAVPTSDAVMTRGSTQMSSVLSGAHHGPVGDRSRRVVWVIFDEADFRRIYAAERPSEYQLTNFEHLAQVSVFATNANSPASITFASVPALLAGVPLGRVGTRIRAPDSLLLETAGGDDVVFGERTTIFGALAARGLAASVLGFYHPYCRIFALSRCDSFAWPENGRPDSALWSNVPGLLSRKFRHFDYWENITRASLQLLPEYIARDDALTFIHLNVPHLPAPYADVALHLHTSSDPLVEYSLNLKLADQILGDIAQSLLEQATRHELLLVVSSDHWLRNRWYQAGKSEVSRPVPLIMWRVGETKGVVLSQPVSTVNTSAMILEYLDGKVTTQSDIANWWATQPEYATFIAPDT